jgi:hypothetical protein
MTPTRLSQNWYVKAKGKVYGPYSVQRMFQFVDEGRLKAHTEIGLSNDGPFYAAQSFDVFVRGDHALEAELVEAVEAHFSNPAPSQPVTPTSIENPHGASGLPGEVFVFIKGDDLDHDAVTTKLVRFGPHIRADEDMYLVKTAAQANQLRNALSRDLPRDACLIIIQGGRETTAWFNLGHEADARIRQFRERKV